jgi:ABC-2 type transport system ATP-binding protein
MIHLDNIHYAYKKERLLFNTLSCEIKPGTICGLLGKNGAGKTSLVKIIAGLLFAQQGSCRVDNYNSKHRHPDMLKQLYFIAEDGQLPALSATQYMALYSVFYPNFSESIFYDCLNSFDVDPKQLLTSMSYGQKKKCIISFALACQCAVTLLDEPTNGLDIPSKSLFRQLVSANMSEDKIFLISTHQVRDVEKLIDRIIIIDEGKIIINNSMEAIAKTLNVSQQSEEPSPASCIYYEKNINNYTVVSASENGDESNIDIELLFNTVINSKDTMKKLFKKEH